MFVPVKNLNGRKFLPCMNNTILDLIKKKNSLRKRIKRNGSPSEYLRNKFKNLRSKVKRMLRESRPEYLNKICHNRDQNPKRFWSFFKSKANYSNILGKVSTKVNDNERKYADNTTDIANMFNHYFASIFTCDSYGSTDHQDRSHNVITIDNITLSEEEIMDVIMNLNNNKAQGPDNIPVRILKETAVQITPLFNVLVSYLMIGKLQMWFLSINTEKRLTLNTIYQFLCYHSSRRFSSVVSLITLNITFTTR